MKLVTESSSTAIIAGLSLDGISLATLFNDQAALKVFDQDPFLINEFAALPGNRAACTTDPRAAFEKADHVFVTAPTVFDHAKKGMDGSSVAEMIDLVRHFNDQATIVIVSPVPTGFTEFVTQVRRDENILVATMVAPTPFGGLTIQGNEAVPSRFKFVLGCDGSVPAGLETLLKSTLSTPDVRWIRTTTRRAETIRDLAFKQRIMNELYLYNSERQFLFFEDFSKELGDGEDLQQSFFGRSLLYGLSDLPGVIAQYLGDKTIADLSKLGTHLQAIGMDNELRLKASVAETLKDYARIGKISEEFLDA